MINKTFIKIILFLLFILFFTIEIYADIAITYTNTSFIIQNTGPEQKIITIVSSDHREVIFLYPFKTYSKTVNTSCTIIHDNIVLFHTIIKTRSLIDDTITPINNTQIISYFSSSIQAYTKGVICVIIAFILLTAIIWIQYAKHRVFRINS